MQNTESASSAHTNLDQYSEADLVNALIDDQAVAAVAVRAASGQLARAVTAAVLRLNAGGRLIYVGAGTSGRLGLLDSVELYPTFSWPHERAVALLAGGVDAIHQAIEGAEDNREQGAIDIVNAAVAVNDVVIVLAASGTTPYTRGALAAARDIGALTIGIANNPDAPMVIDADIGITLNTGAEVISGSTRLKAGTAQKIALNTLSSAIMVRLNKVYGNLMVDVKPTNAKLVRRTINLVMQATHATEMTARETLEACGYRVKIAIVAIITKTSVARAEQRLDAAKGSVREAIR